MTTTTETTVASAKRDRRGAEHRRRGRRGAPTPSRQTPGTKAGTAPASTTPGPASPAGRARRLVWPDPRSPAVHPRNVR